MHCFNFSSQQRGIRSYNEDKMAEEIVFSIDLLWLINVTMRTVKSIKFCLLYLSEASCCFILFRCWVVTLLTLRLHFRKVHLKSQVGLVRMLVKIVFHIEVLCYIVI